MKLLRPHLPRALSPVRLAGRAATMLALCVAGSLGLGASSVRAAEGPTRDRPASSDRGVAAFATAPAGLGVALLTSPAAPSPAAVAPANASADATAAQARLAAYLATLRPIALKSGIRPATFDTLTSGLAPYEPVLARAASQPELVRTTASYIQALVSANRVALGRQALTDHSDLLARIEQRYGVPRQILVAIWGIETLYGARKGNVPVVQALATLASAGDRRRAFWQQQLVGAMQLVERGDLPVAALVGSWAGAIGHTQMIPTTYLAHAVDFDGDGRRDLTQSPSDALASAAAYLKASGWVDGEPWGFEVKLPARFDYALAGADQGGSREIWEFLGVTRPDGSRIPAARGDLKLLFPAGASGPAFLVTANMRALRAYNNSLSYMLAVGLLGDQIAGGDGLATAWPPQDNALNSAERRELQVRLQAVGHDPGGADGVFGPGTRAAVRAYQRATGLPQDGYAGRALLETLRQASLDPSDGERR